MKSSVTKCSIKGTTPTRWRYRIDAASRHVATAFEDGESALITSTLTGIT